MTDPSQQFLTPTIFIIDSQTSEIDAMNQELTKLQSPPKAEDIIIINQELSTIKIEQVRQLGRELSYASYSSHTRYVVILAADLLTIPAQNSFLKLLEEPPANTAIWMITSYPELLLPTIRSRCTELFRIDRENANRLTVIKSAEINIDELVNFSHRSLIDLAEANKDRQQAQSYILNMIYATHQMMENFPDQKKYQLVLEYALTAHQQLAANTNPQLTLEHCFFACKQVLSAGN